MIRNEVDRLLPRDRRDGTYLKAASHATRDDQVAKFARSVLKHEVDVSLITLDVDDAENTINVDNAKRFANHNRRALGKPRLTRIDSAYWLFYPKAIIHAWGKCSERRGKQPRKLRIVFDSEQIREDLAQEIADSLVESFAEQQVEVDAVEWQQEEDEPLLHAPDLLAGARLRHHRFSDCPRTDAVLTKQAEKGRIAIPRVVEILTLPSSEELDSLGA